MVVCLDPLLYATLLYSTLLYYTLPYYTILYYTGPMSGTSRETRFRRLPRFVTWFENRSFPEPYLHGPWDESVYLYSDKRMELKLGCCSGAEVKLP